MNWNMKKIYMYTALMGRALGVFPILILASKAYSLTYSISEVVVELLVTILVAVIGYLQIELQNIIVEKLDNRTWLATITIGISYLIEVGIILGWVIGCLKVGIMMQVILSTFYLVIYGASIAAYKKHYMNILGTETAVASTILYIAAMVKCHNDIVGLMYILVMGSNIFLANQYKLETLSESSKGNTPMFKRIKRDNIKWLGIILICFLVFFPLKKHIARILHWVLIKVIIGISYILKFFAWLSNLLVPMQTVEGVGADPLPILDDSPSMASTVSNIIFWLMVILTTTFFFYKKRKEILNTIKALIHKLITLMKNLYELLFARKQALRDETGYYEDTIEEISPELISKLKRREMMSQRKWVKEVKKYLKQSSGHLQYRVGYRLVLQGIQFRGIPVKIDNTPRELMSQVREQLEIREIEQVTKDYEDVRYDEKQEGIQEIDELKQVLNSMLQ